MLHSGAFWTKKWAHASVHNSASRQQTDHVACITLVEYVHNPQKKITEDTIRLQSQIAALI